MPPPIPTPLDGPFHGTIELVVNATDTDHQIFSVHETIPIQTTGDTILLYPEWETASHAPTATVAELAGLVVHIDGKRSDWVRDPIAMHAFHVNVLEGSKAITLDFQFLAPSTAGLLRPEMVEIPWQRVLLYPAGWYVRDIHVAATLVMPRGLTPFTALAFQRVNDGVLSFETATLDQLVDAPVHAGRYTRQILLNENAGRPVKLDLLADAEGGLGIDQSEIERMKALVTQCLKVFGAAPYRHYDAIVTLGGVSSGGGIEHLEEGEIGLPDAYFNSTSSQLNNRDLIAHEFVHAWNGRSREPADLWSPNFNLPVVGSLLWVYEGQTEFWGRVLAARAGLRDSQQTVDKLAMDAAIVANREGRSWKDLQDSTLDAIYMAGHRVQWRDWQRREDYYPEGVLLWLDVDARLRELSHGRRGLDDFARLFFDAHEGGQTTRTYTLQDVCDVLNQVAQDDWAALFDGHLRTHNADDALAGLARAGWKLTYRDTSTVTFREAEQEAGGINLDYSIGLQISNDGRIQSVRWDGPAFRAGLTAGVQVVQVNGQAFTPGGLIAAVRESATTPVSLHVDSRGSTRVVEIDYQEGLRYPSLERIVGAPDRLSALLDTR